MRRIDIRADYATARRAAYPDIVDQLDALVKAIDAIRRGEPLPAEAVAVLDKVQTVKAAYPKPKE